MGSRLALAFLFLAGVAAHAQAPDSVDLSPRFESMGLSPKRQGARNTCSVFTLSGALEFAVSARRGTGTRLSEEYLNWACNQVIGNRTQDRGQFFSDLWKGFERFGACEEKECPYAPAFDPSLEPTADAIASANRTRALGLRLHWIKRNNGKAGICDDHLEEMKRVLALGWPVCAGSGHSVLLTGYSDGWIREQDGWFLVRDSGGAPQARMPFEEAKSRLCDVLWIEAPGAPSPAEQLFREVEDRYARARTLRLEGTASARVGPHGGDLRVSKLDAVLAEGARRKVVEIRYLLRLVGGTARSTLYVDPESKTILQREIETDLWVYLETTVKVEVDAAIGDVSFTLPGIEKPK